MMDLPGSRAEKCFLFDRTLARKTWKAVESMPLYSGAPPSADDKDRPQVSFYAKVLKPDVIGMLRNVIVVPPLFHLYHHLQKYVITTFCAAVGVTDSVLFDKLRVETGPVLHGRTYESGEARMAVSWAAVILGESTIAGVHHDVVKRYLHMLELLHEVQQLLYCRWTASEVARFRMHVVTRLLAEAVRLVDPERTRNVYWANFFVALPAFCERFSVPLHLLLEEKFEQVHCDHFPPFH